MNHYWNKKEYAAWSELLWWFLNTAHCQWRKFGSMDPMMSVLLVCWFWLNIGLS